MSTHPEERVRTLVVVTPRNTAKTSAQSTEWPLGSGVIRRVDVVIPSGHAGLTGIAFQWGARQVVPYEGGEWITGNDDEVILELGLYVHGSPLVVLTYNTDDAFTHSHHLRAYVSELVAPEPAFLVPFVPLAPSELEPGGGITDDEWDAVVSAASEAFLLELQNVLDNFLFELRTTLGETPTPFEPEPEPEPEPEAEVPVPAAPTEERIQVPDVVGATRERARDRLARAGFTVKVELVTQKGTAGVVVDQQPRGGAMRARGFTVTIIVRRNPR